MAQQGQLTGGQGSRGLEEDVQVMDLYSTCSDAFQKQNPVLKIYQTSWSLTSYELLLPKLPGLM